nr:6K2 protein [Moroccan watermelon mosaic virus]
ETNGRVHVVKELELKGIWNKSLLCQDALVSAFVFCGGAFMLWQHYKEQFKLKHVYHQ